MTAFTLGMRFVSLGFNVYITGKIGAEGIGLYSLIMSVGGFAITLATSGVNLASTRLCARALGKGNLCDLRRAMTRCIGYSILFSSVSSIALFNLARPISVGILGEVRCILPLKVFSLGLPFISLGSALSGYFTAVRRVYKSATVGIIEQFVTIYITVRLIALMLPKGIEYACTAVILGAAVSETLAFICSFILYRLDLYRHNDNSGEREEGMMAMLLEIALPVAFSAYVRSGLVAVEHILIPKGLKKYGAGKSGSLASYGVLHGMAMPLVLFPMAIVSAFAGLLVPEITGSLAAGENGRVNGMVSRSIQLTLMFAIGCSGILVCFGEFLGEAIYSNADAGLFIRMMAPLIPVMYFDHITDGMLKGMGEQLYSMRVNIFDSLLSVILVWLILPRMGIFGYVVIIYTMEILNAALSVSRLLRCCDVRVKILDWFVKPLACVIISTTLARWVYRMMPSFVSDTTGKVAAVIMSCVIYFIALRITRSFSGEDVKWFKNAIK